MAEVYDESSTARDMQWMCNACTFTTESKDAAKGHAVDSRDWGFPHMLCERRSMDQPPVRRIAVEASGAVNTERIERKRRS